MIRVAGHARNTGSRVFQEDAARSLFVNCCGYQHFMTRDFSIQRPGGRPDYQILYVCKGCGHYCIDGQWTVMPAGSIILYRPLEPQIYQYFAKDDPEIYWLHFLGTESDGLLKEYHIHNGFIGRHQSIKQLFDEIILECQLRKPRFQEVVTADFHKLLALIDRLSLALPASQEGITLIEKLIARLNRHYMEVWDIQMMADYCHLSTDYFSHRFKQVTGVSPIQFLNNLRIERAKELLLAEHLSVSEVAELVGYKDPLYFSKAFKKATGMSPKLFHGNRWLIDGTSEL